MALKANLVIHLYYYTYLSRGDEVLILFDTEK